MYRSIKQRLARLDREFMRTSLGKFLEIVYTGRWATLTHFIVHCLVSIVQSIQNSPFGQSIRIWRPISCLHFKPLQVNHCKLSRVMTCRLKLHRFWFLNLNRRSRAQNYKKPVVGHKIKLKNKMKSWSCILSRRQIWSLSSKEINECKLNTTYKLKKNYNKQMKECCSNIFFFFFFLLLQYNWKEFRAAILNVHQWWQG